MCAKKYIVPLLCFWALFYFFKCRFFLFTFLHIYFLLKLLQTFTKHLRQAENENQHAESLGKYLIDCLGNTISSHAIFFVDIKQN